MIQFVKTPTTLHPDDDDLRPTITFTIDSDYVSWPLLIDNFLEFLRACGYLLVDKDVVQYLGDTHEQP